MERTIIGNKAIYFIESINNIGDYRITMTGHKEYKDASWMVGDFDYMASIDRIESGKPMLLEKR